jgi:glycosyltransferase involved in cell wall biosynthesis
MEAYSVTGPAKNLFEFAKRAAAPDLPFRAHVSIVTFQRRESSTQNAFIRSARAAGLDIEVIPERFAFDPSILKRIREIVQSRRPDIVQTHNVKSHFLVRLLGIKRESRWIAFQHGYTWTDLKMRAYNQLDRFSLSAADRVVTVCGAFAERLRRTGVSPDQIEIQHNTVKPFIAPPSVQVDEIRRRLAIPQEALVIIAAGRLSREKGHNDLVRAFAALQQEPDIPRCRLLIAGDGPERESIEHAAKSLRIADSLILLGQVDNVAPYYALADLMVLPSHTEGSPNVLLEAMAAGLPVVATTVGGVPEILRNGETGLLVQRSDIVGMAKAIKKLLEDKSLRERFGAVGKVEARRYDPEHYCKSLLEIYSRVLDRDGVPERG